MRTTFELAKVIRDYGDDFALQTPQLKQHLRVLNAIKSCRTASLGGHLERCNNEKCSHERIAYNSCRNRHCPKCQTTNKERWILARKADTLNCTYFHVVFTLPHELNAFCLKYPKTMYELLFAASHQTISAFAADPKHLGVQGGAISLLHTWGQNLSLHPHVHMIVPGGGFTTLNHWKNAPANGRFLFPVRAMAQVYRAKFMEKFLLFLKQNKLPVDVELRRKLYDKNWVVYAKQPFQNADGVVEYLGRYSHKIAISNHRIKNIENRKVTFTYKDYAHGSVTKLMTLDAHEFLRRFCLHILPPKFVKIRHYGFLSSRGKIKLKIRQVQLGILPPKHQKQTGIPFAEIARTRLGFDPEACPCCKTGKMIIVMQFGANAPPSLLQNTNNKLKMNTL